MPCPFQSSWFDHPNDIWWVQGIKIFLCSLLHSPVIDSLSPNFSITRQSSVSQSAPLKNHTSRILECNLHLQQYEDIISQRMLLTISWANPGRALAKKHSSCPRTFSITLFPKSSSHPSLNRKTEHNAIRDVAWWIPFRNSNVLNENTINFHTPISWENLQETINFPSQFLPVLQT